MEEKKIKKYKLQDYGSFRINEVYVERESPVSVWIKGDRLAKSTNYAIFFDSVEDLKKHIIEKTKIQIDYLNSQVKHCDRKLKEAMERLKELE